MSEEAAPESTGQEADASPESSEGQANTWYNGASEEIVGYIQNKGWQEEPLKAVEAYQNLEKFHGVPADRIIKLPKDFAEEGALDEIYTKLGRPKAPENYEYEAPEDFKIDDNRLNTARDVAHKIGLNQDQFKALVDMDIEYSRSFAQEFQKDVEARQEAEVSKLKDEWGSGFEEKAELGRRFIRDNLPDGLDKVETVALIEDAIGTANTLRLFGNAGQNIRREDKIDDSTGERPFGYTREQAMADKTSLMDELKADPQRLANYNKGIGPDVGKMKNLNKVIAA